MADAVNPAFGTGFSGQIIDNNLDPTSMFTYQCFTLFYPLINYNNNNMKKLTILLSLFLTISVIANAQRLKVNSITKAKHSSFKTEINQYGRMNVENEKNTLNKKRPKNQRVELADQGIFGVAAAFKQVFSETRLKELLSENTMLVSYYVSPGGKVLEVSFVLKPETLVTAAELEALEIAIKEKVSLKLVWRDNDKQEADFVSISQAVHYSAILNGTLKN
jgi:hypothetical protein